MSIDEITEFLEELADVVTLRPVPGDGSPEVAWGDTFFYYSPDGTVPTTAQPFATVVTKDYPDDTGLHLSRTDAFRVNIHAGRDAFLRWTGREPRETVADGGSPSTDDTVMAHPVYGSLGWLAVVNPGERTGAAVRDLLRSAHDLARSRYERRTESRSQ